MALFAVGSRGRGESVTTRISASSASALLGSVSQHEAHHLLNRCHVVTHARCPPLPGTPPCRASGPCRRRACSQTSFLSRPPKSREGTCRAVHSHHDSAGFRG